jgi:hypothetical protein
LPLLSPSSGEYYQSTAAMKKKKQKITRTVIMVSAPKKGNIGDKGKSKKPPTMPIRRQPGELRYVKTIVADTKKEELLEQLKKF